jgi:hypothetical protein
MIHECEHFYETGRKCRRITKRGQALCPGHQPNPRRSVHDEPAFARQIEGFVEQLRAIDDVSLLCSLQDALNIIQPLIEQKTTRANYVRFARASVVVGVTVERLLRNQERRSAAVANAAQQQGFESR